MGQISSAGGGSGGVGPAPASGGGGGGGVSIDPDPAQAGQAVTITYDPSGGPLGAATAGAAVVGGMGALASTVISESDAQRLQNLPAVDIG